MQSNTTGNVPGNASFAHEAAGLVKSSAASPRQPSTVAGNGCSATTSLPGRRNAPHRPDIRLQPVCQCKSDPDLIRVLIVIDQTFTIAVEVLDIALHVRITPQGKTPTQFDSTLAEAGLEIVA